ncbi:MAG: hypothetical protein M1830_008320 [Pleopsidium flavum]|nr:MAG: hypothetical protein M1830_008320 [Pleopsidium flavum]
MASPHQRPTNSAILEQNFTSPTASFKHSGQSHAPLRQHKRQTNLPPFGGQAQQQVMVLATAIYIVEVINNRGNLTQVCNDLNATALYLEGLDGNLAKQKICAAALSPLPPTNSSAITEIIALATALYAVEVAGNYAGGTNLTNLCNVVDVNTISLLGFDGISVKNFVCAAAAGTSLAPTSTGTTLATAVTAAAVSVSPGLTGRGTT